MNRMRLALLISLVLVFRPQYPQVLRHRQFSQLFSNYATEPIAGLLNLWPELLPNIREALFLPLRKIQISEIGNLMGQSIANQLLALRS